VELTDLEREVRWYVYQHFIETGSAPNTPMLVRETASDLHSVEKSLHRLADARALVLSPGSSSVWMAHPFSALPPPYPVHAGGKRYWANCAWDVLGIAALLGTDTTSATLCPDCGESLMVRVSGDSVMPPEGLVHFLVRPQDFWEDIGFT
jgi:hypothetical protein